MKTVLSTAAAFAMAAAMASPALAQQASEQAAATHGGGQCAFSQAMLQAMADGKQERMAETKSKIDALVENALASSRAAKVAQTPIEAGTESPDS